MGHWPTHEFSDDCVHGIPGLWAVNETPEFVWVTYSGIEPSNTWVPEDGPAPNRTIKLIHSVLLPCTWLGLESGIAADWTLRAADSLCDQITPDLEVSYFHAVAGVPFATTFTSLQGIGGPEPFYGGQAIVTW